MVERPRKRELDTRTVCMRTVCWTESAPSPPQSSPIEKSARRTCRGDKQLTCAHSTCTVPAQRSQSARPIYPVGEAHVVEGGGIARDVAPQCDVPDAPQRNVLVRGRARGRVRSRPGLGLRLGLGLGLDHAPWQYLDRRRVRAFDGKPEGRAVC